MDLPIVPDARTAAWPGGARAYEDALMREMEQANADEARLRREGLEAAMERALSRSGIYNVGSLMIPQDAGEVALGAAMMPGPMGLGMRGVLAALGGMTTQLSEAEGAFLPREMFRRLRGHPSPAARREGDRGLAAIQGAQDNTGISDVDFQLWSPEELNAQFPALLSMGARYGAMPTENGWTALLDPTRPMRDLPAVVAGSPVAPPRTLLDFDLQHANPPRAVPRTLNEYRLDPWLESALGQPNPRLRIEPTSYNGWYNPSNDQLGLRAGLSPLDARHTLEHELQHRIQRYTPGRERVGQNTESVRGANPDLWNEYLTRAQAPDPNPGSWTQVSGGLSAEDAEQAARYAMYRDNFGEWEARMAADAQILGRSPTHRWIDIYEGLVNRELDGPNSLPDFRIR